MARQRGEIMPGRRRRSCNEPGHAHELTFTCYRRSKFLAAERTCQWLAESIGDSRACLEFDLWGFVFMPEHVHLVVHPRRDDHEMAKILSAIKEPVGRRAMRFLEERAPEWLPRLTRRRGERVERLFWQSGGGFDRNIVEPRTLMAVLDYVHMNPVRRGLAARASDWRWSSAGWYEGFDPCGLVPDPIPPEWVPPE
jgi:putative transposase